VTPVVPPYRRGGGFGSLGLRFAEVSEPAPVPLGPQTLGAWLTLAAVALALVLALAWLVRRHVQRRYRRLAERELRALEAAWAASANTLQALEPVPALLKRCALQGFARPQVASLSGVAWLRFLDATGAGPFGEAAGRALLAITTRGPSAVAPADAPRLFAAARTWVRRHRAEL
jgi:uncharacterized protein DUF4381